MQSASKPRWQQMTAVVSLGAGGAITGMSFVPGTVAELTSPASVPVRLLALQQSAKPAAEARPASDEATLRTAIVNVARHYLRLAENLSPAEMEALIWRHDSENDADHGPSCAAFASLTLELASRLLGRTSWVTGGSSYPWPLHDWADVRVDPNPASPGIVSVLQDARQQHRWHPLGDGYRPRPGDWVLFSGHVEVVTGYSGGVLSTIGGDSLPNFSVNAHAYSGPLSSQGVAGFVNNGLVKTPKDGQAGSDSDSAGRQQAGPAHAGHPAGRVLRRRRGHGGRPHGRRAPGHPATARTVDALGPASGSAAIPGTTAMPATGTSGPAAVPGATEGSSAAAGAGTAIPGLSGAPRHPAAADAPAGHHYRRHLAQPVSRPGDTSAERAFIGMVARGAIATQREFGVPAAVTIAQAIDESGWGRSGLATRDHNLFGIKGTGPAGSDSQVTQEYENGQLVTKVAPFRVYRDVAESISDHARLLATSGYYHQAMAERHDPNAFAAALTGVYATNPDYGTQLVSLMRRYNLYRFDRAARLGMRHVTAAGTAIPGLLPSEPAQPHQPQQPGRPGQPGRPHHSAPPPTSPAPPARTPAPPHRPQPAPQPGSPASPAPGAPAGPTAPASGNPVQPVSRVPVRPAPDVVSAQRLTATGVRVRQRPAGKAGRTRDRYQPQMPTAVRNAFLTTAQVPLLDEQPLYRDVAGHHGIRWELLAACDWMQCEAHPRHSPVYGERLGTVNPDGTVYRTRSEALERCAEDLVELSAAVYRIDLTAAGCLSVRDLANVFAAFRWGGLLRMHRTSALEFPYSVAGLTVHHTNMRWPNIAEPNAPDKPGGRFRQAFGAVPIVLSLNYPATV